MDNSKIAELVEQAMAIIGYIAVKYQNRDADEAYEKLEMALAALLKSVE